MFSQNVALKLRFIFLHHTSKIGNQWDFLLLSNPHPYCSRALVYLKRISDTYKHSTLRHFWIGILFANAASYDEVWEISIQTKLFLSCFCFSNLFGNSNYFSSPLHYLSLPLPLMLYISFSDSKAFLVSPHF